MSLLSLFRGLGRKTSDRVVGVTSGTTPIGLLDSPGAYRTIFGLGMIALGVSGWLIYHSVFNATALPKANTAATNTTTLAELEKLKTVDTDGDGISDYDELYSTKTSPYLKDSDGDRVNDADEITKGTDPNCPTGKVCSGFRLLTTPIDANGQLTPEFLRRALQSAGVPQATLDQLDDAGLLRIYQQVLSTTPTTNTNSAAGSNANTAAVNTNTSPSSALQQIENLTPTQIRELLIQNGIDAASLQSVDDATLRQIFLEAISSSQ